jgi:hypothetical protein
MTNATSEIFEVLENPNIVLNILKEGELSPEERIELSTYFTASLRAREFAWLQWRHRVIDGLISEHSATDASFRGNVTWAGTEDPSEAHPGR